MSMPPVFWGLLASPLWGAMYILSGNLLAAVGVPWAYLVDALALVTATYIIVRIDAGMRRPRVPAVGWQVPVATLAAAALLAGVGAAILGSEIDNIVRDRVPLVVPAPSTDAAAAVQMAPGPDAVLAVGRGLIAPICLGILGLGIALRNVAMGLPMWLALTFGALATAFPGHEHPAYWLPWLLGPMVGGWAYARSHSLWVGIAALLPQHLVIFFGVLGITPGIPGFDTEIQPVVVFQPVWFDALGAVCLAAGVFWFIQGVGRVAATGGLARPKRPAGDEPE